MRYAQLDGTTVINVIELEEPLEEWDGHPVVQSDEAGPGDTYDGKTFTRPEPIATEPVPPTPLEIIAKALLADSSTSQAVKDAVQAALVAGGAEIALPAPPVVPMVPKKG